VYWSYEGISALYSVFGLQLGDLGCLTCGDLTAVGAEDGYICPACTERSKKKLPVVKPTTKPLALPPSAPWEGGTITSVVGNGGMLDDVPDIVRATLKTTDHFLFNDRDQKCSACGGDIYPSGLNATVFSHKRIYLLCAVCTDEFNGAMEDSDRDPNDSLVAATCHKCGVRTTKPYIKRVSLGSDSGLIDTFCAACARAEETGEPNNVHVRAWEERDGVKVSTLVTPARKRPVVIEGTIISGTEGE
jgi:hypothetical protein